MHQAQDISKLEHCKEALVNDYIDALHFYAKYPILSEKTRDFFVKEKCNYPKTENPLFYYPYSFDGASSLTKGLIFREKGSLEIIKLEMNPNLTKRRKFNLNGYSELSKKQMHAIYKWYKNCISSFVNYAQKNRSKSIPTAHYFSLERAKEIPNNEYIIYKEHNKEIVFFYLNYENTKKALPISKVLTSFSDSIISGKLTPHAYPLYWEAGGLNLDSNISDFV